MVPRWSLVLGVTSALWDHASPTLYPGRGPTRGARTTTTWDGPWSQPPHTTAPRAATGRGVWGRRPGSGTRRPRAQRRDAHEPDGGEGRIVAHDRPSGRSQCRRLRYCEGEARRGATRGHGEGKKREQGEAHGTDDGRVLAARRHRRGVRRVGGRRRSDRDGGLRGEEAAHGVCKWSNMDQSLAPFAGTVVLLSSEPSERWQGLVLPL